jgi:hypothetical protein
MERYRRLWTLGLVVTTAVLASLFAGRLLSAQTPPLGSGPISSEPELTEASPRLFAGPKGEPVRLSYRREPSGATGIVVATSAAGGEWKPLVEIIPRQKDVTAGSADLTVGPDGQLTVAYQWWRHMPTSSKQIRLARSTDGGKTWIQPETSLDTSGKAFNPKVVWGRNQNLVVVWADEQRSNRVWDVYARRSPDGGTTWETEQLLSRFAQNTPTDAYIRPEIVTDGDRNVWVAWVGIRSGRSRVFLSRSTDGGGTWADPLELSGQSQSVFGQRILRSGQNLLIVWQDKRTGRDRLFAVSSADSGATWSAATRVDHLPDDLQTDTVAPAVVMSPAREAIVIWHDGRNGRDDIFLGRSADGGRTWDAKDIRLDMDEAGTAVSRFATATRAADGKIAVAWEDDRAGYEAVYLRVRSAGAQPTWGPEILVEGAGVKKGARQVAMLWMPDGSLEVAWEAWNYRAGPLAVSKRIEGRRLSP